MADRVIPFPVEGLDNSVSLARQSPLTSSFMRNIRAADASTGRVNGARRAGADRWCAAQVGSGPILDVAGALVDSGHVRNEQRPGGEVTWRADTSTKGDGLDVVIDSVGNSYVVDDGRSITVLSREGKLVRTITPNTLRPAQFQSADVSFGAIAVDEALRVYVGVSAGGRESDAVLMCIDQPLVDGEEPVLVWRLNLGGFISRILARDSHLFVTVNSPQRGRSAVVKLALQGNSQASEVWRVPALFPASGVSVAKAGDVYVSSLAASNNRGTPRSGTDSLLEDFFASWTPRRNQVGYADDAYAVFDPAALALEDGAAVVSLDDVDGSARSIQSGLSPAGAGGLVGALAASALGSGSTTAFVQLLANPSDGVTVTWESSTGGLETWRFKTTIAQAYDILIGASAAATLTNWLTTIKDGGNGTASPADTPPSALLSRVGSASGATVAVLAAVEAPSEVWMSSSNNAQVTHWNRDEADPATLSSDTGDRYGFARRGPPNSGDARTALLESAAPRLVEEAAPGVPGVRFTAFTTMFAAPNPNGGVAGRDAAHRSHTSSLPNWHSKTAGSQARVLAAWVLRPDAGPPASVWTEFHRASGGSASDRVRKRSTLIANGRLNDAPGVGLRRVIGEVGAMSFSYSVGSDRWSFDGAYSDAAASHVRCHPSGVVLVTLQTDPAGSTQVFYNGTPGSVAQRVAATRVDMTDTTTDSGTDRVTAVTPATFDAVLAGDLVYVFNAGTGTGLSVGFQTILAVDGAFGWVTFNDGAGSPVALSTGGGAQLRFNVYRNSTRVLTAKNAGLDLLSGRPPTHIWVRAGTGATLGVHPVQSVTNNNTVVLATALGADVVDGTLDVVALHCSAPPLERRTTAGQTLWGMPGNNLVALGASYRGDLLYFQAFSRLASWSTTDRQLLEGFLAWRFGISTALPASHPFASAPPNASGNTTGFYTSKQALGAGAALAKYRQTGRLGWIATTDTRFGSGTNIGGIGVDCAADDAGGVFSIGSPISLDLPSVRRIVDRGSAFSLATGDGAWSDEIELEGLGTEGLVGSGLRIALDKQGRLYVPVRTQRFEGVPPLWLRYSPTGTRELQPSNVLGFTPTAIAIDPTVDATDILGVPGAGRAVLSLRRQRVVRMSFTAQPAAGSTFALRDNGDAGSQRLFTFVAGAPADRAEVQIGATLQATMANIRAQVSGFPEDYGFVYAFALDAGGSAVDFVSRLVEDADGTPHVLSVVLTGTTNATVTTEAISGPSAIGIDLVTSTVVDQGRAFYAVAVSGGQVTMATRTTPIIPSGSFPLSPSADFVSIVVMGNSAFIADGLQVLELDMRKRTLAPLTPEGRGSVPTQCRIMESYLGGLVFAGDARDPTNWYMTARGNPRDLDQSPFGGPFATQATEGAVSLAGLAPVKITGLCNIADDLLMFFGAGQTWRLTGDPMQNGRFDLVSGEVGAAFGRAWARDPSGRNVFFWNPENGLYVTDGVSVRPVNPRRLTRSMRAVDLTKFRIRMTWDFLYDGLMIGVCPLFGVTERPVSFFWERATNALLEDDRAAWQVTSLTSVNGDDPRDRELILGCSDGFLRRQDAEADDDGTPIDSFVRIGPLTAGSPAHETILDRLHVMLDLFGGEASVDVETSESAAEPPRVVRTVRLQPGLNAPQSVRVAGGYVWLTFRSRSRWVIEQIVASMSVGSARRIRAR